MAKLLLYRQVNMEKTYGSLFTERAGSPLISQITMQRSKLMTGSRCIEKEYVILDCEEQECMEKIPWLSGVKPREAYWLDNPDHLRALGISFRDGEKRADYYIRDMNDTWILIERKNGSSRLDTALEQLRDTKAKLVERNRPVDRLVTVADKFGHNDDKAFGRVRNRKNLLFAKRTSRKDGLPLCGVNVEFFTSEEVQSIKQGGIMSWLSR